MSETPIVSVIMPAFNSARWVGEAINSILGQTFPSLELIVVDDGSTDRTLEIVSALHDSRVALVKLESNSGSAAARNAGLKRARGEFIALMDSDDIALPRWLERQVGFLQRNPDCGLCGAWVRTFGAREGVWTTYATHEHIKADLLFRCGLNQNTVVFRRQQMQELGFQYDPGFVVSQDYDLWTRCVDSIRMANTPEVLVSYRVHASNVSVSKKRAVREASRQVRVRQLNKLGIHPTPEEVEIHDELGEYGPSGRRDRTFDVQALERWLLKLQVSNATSGYVPTEVFEMLLYEYWRRCCRSGSGLFDPGIPRFLVSNIAPSISRFRKLKDLMKIILGRQLYSLPNR